MGKMARTVTPLRATFEAACKQLDGAQSRVGWFASAQYPDGTPAAYVAVIQEFGSEEQHIPSRATIRPTMAEQGPAWSKIIADGSKGVVHGKLTADQVMNGVGLQAAGDCRKAIAALTEPKLAESTLAVRRARGNASQKPLVDTQVLITSLTHNIDRASE